MVEIGRKWNRTAVGQRDVTTRNHGTIENKRMQGNDKEGNVMSDDRPNQARGRNERGSVKDRKEESVKVRRKENWTQWSVSIVVTHHISLYISTVTSDPGVLSQRGVGGFDMERERERERENLDSHIMEWPTVQVELNEWLQTVQISEKK